MPTSVLGLFSACSDRFFVIIVCLCRDVACYVSTGGLFRLFPCSDAINSLSVGVLFMLCRCL